MGMVRGLWAYPSAPHPAPQREDLCDNDSSGHLEESAALDIFAQSNDIEKAFRDLFAFF